MGYNGTVWYSEAWYGMVWYACSGLVRVWDELGWCADYMEWRGLIRQGMALGWVGWSPGSWDGVGCKNAGIEVRRSWKECANLSR